MQYTSQLPRVCLQEAPRPLAARDPGSSSSPESRSLGDWDSSLVVAVCGENSTRDGATKQEVGGDVRSSSEDEQRGPRLCSAQSRWGEVHRPGRNPQKCESDNPWNSTRLRITRFSTARANAEEGRRWGSSCWCGYIDARVKANLTCPNKH